MTSLSQTVRSTDLSNGTCAVQSPPNSDIPDGYRSFQLGTGSILPQGYRNIDKDELYDLYTRQTRVWALTGFFRNKAPETVVICVAPNNTQAGSRVPEGEWPPQGTSDTPAGQDEEDKKDDENAGIARDSQLGSWIAMAAAGTLAMFLI